MVSVRLEFTYVPSAWLWNQKICTSPSCRYSTFQWSEYWRKRKKKGSNAKLVFAGTWSRKQFRSLFKIGVGSCLTKAGERSTAWDSLYFHHLPSPPFEAETWRIKSHSFYIWKLGKCCKLLHSIGLDFWFIMGKTSSNYRIFFPAEQFF